MSILRALWNLHMLRRHLWLQDSQLEKIKNKMLVALISYAYHNVPFYHRTWKSHNIRPEDIRKSEDLAKLPIIVKKDIQNTPADFIARNISLDKCTRRFTAGSTGSKVTIYCDPKAEDFRAAVFTRPFLECGLGIRDKGVFITRSPERQRWFQRLGFLKRMYLSASAPEEESLERMLSFNPDMIYSYSSYLHLLARAIKTTGTAGLEPELIIGTGELLYDNTRRLVEDAFNVQMLDFYGSVEVERTAWECPERVGHHMDVDSTIVEFTKESEEVAFGERGELTLTCLYNYAMPLIRFNIEDTGIPTTEKCPCGRSLPLMKEIEGRSNDFVVLEDGRMISPLSFFNAIWAVPYEMFVDFKIIQMTKNRFVIKIVGQEEHYEEIQSKLQENVRKIVGEIPRIEVQMVDQIKKEPSGKTKTVVSNVPKPF